MCLKGRSTFAMLAVLLATSGQAQLAFDQAANYQAGQFAYGVNSNQGYGFNPWTWSASSGSPTAILASSNTNGGLQVPGIDDASGTSFGVIAPGVSDEIQAHRTFNPLQTNGTFSFDFDCGNINPAGGSYNSQIFIRNSVSNFRLQFSGTGVFADGFYFSGGSQSVSVLAAQSLGPKSFGGYHLVYTMTGSNSATVSIKRLADSQNFNYSFSFPASSAAMSEVLFRQYDCGAGNGNAMFFNNLQVTGVPEPSTLLAVAGFAALAVRRKR